MVHLILNLDFNLGWARFGSIDHSKSGKSRSACGSSELPKSSTINKNPALHAVKASRTLSSLPVIMDQRKENIVMFPFMAQGHIIPFLALAIELEQKRGCTVTFASTPLNIKRIRPSLPPNSSIQLLEIPFRSSDHGLPPDCENTHDLPYHLILKLVEASRSLKPSFHKLVYDLVRKQHGQLPLCIISDSFFGWCADIVHELGVFHAIFFSVLRL